MNTFFKKTLLSCLIFFSVCTPVMVQAAITYVGGQEASGTTAAYNLALNTLSGGSASSTAIGDLVIVVNASVSNGINGNPGVGTAGYNEITDVYTNDTTHDLNYSVSWKILSSAETTVSCNAAPGLGAASVCVAKVWRGVHQTTPFTASSTASGIDSTVPDPPSITPTTAATFVVVAGASAAAAGDTAVTDPTNYGTQVHISSDPGTASVAALAHRTWSGASAEDPAAWTNWDTNADAGWAATTMAIQPAPVAPTVTTSAATATTTSSATLNGSITDTGGANPTVRGFEWGDEDWVSVEGVPDHTTVETGSFSTGDFGTFIRGLVAGRVYYFRAYATNSAGTSYGTLLNFTAGVNTSTVRTLRLFEGYSIKFIDGTIRLYATEMAFGVTTDSSYCLNATTQNAVGTITGTDGLNATTRGVVFGQSATMQDSSTTTENGSFGIGSFAASMTSLEQDKTYYYKIYATNSTGTVYGDILNFVFDGTAC